LGIALASCIGGLTSPISSPQNIITISIMQPNPGWGNWFAASLPIAIITVVTTWACLLLYFKPHRITPCLNTIKAQEFAFPSLTQIFITVICLATIGLWCSETAIQNFWGDNGVIAAIPFVLFFGTGVLAKTDLNNFLWPVVILAQGGMALGFVSSREVKGVIY
jgi:phosphate transporter